ncbi:DUF551 domain-containing protein [Mesorhizobium caraganae]|uniref:DUF551 domain-containing protein n=1 Tax=Mesorhizobium caraganae TaxID=483206 RepID=UPI00177AF514
MPIETAPETIGDYIVWFPAEDGYLAKASAARWNGYHWTDSGYRTDEGHEPTHWQPLPAPPVTP